MSKKGHIPSRMCVGCRKRRRKEEMVRFGHFPDGAVSLSEKKDLRGRGFYLCADLTCFEMARKKDRTGRLVGIDGSLVSLNARLRQPMKRSTE